MPTTTTTFQRAADELYGAFTSGKRNDETTFYKLRDDAPKWTTEDDESGQCLMLRVHRAVDGRLPDDWIYEQAYWLAGRIAEKEDADGARDSLSEWADGLVDVYNADRTRWLASHLGNLALVDEAVEEMGRHDQGIVGNIALGQFMALERIGNALIEEIEKRAEQLDEEAAD